MAPHCTVGSVLLSSSFAEADSLPVLVWFLEPSQFLVLDWGVEFAMLLWSLRHSECLVIPVLLLALKVCNWEHF